MPATASTTACTISTQGSPRSLPTRPEVAVAKEGSQAPLGSPASEELSYRRRPDANSIASISTGYEGPSAEQIESRRRTIAARASEKDYKNLVQQRQTILMSSTTVNLSSTERRKLQLIQWQIDQIEDAWYGAGLDRLEAAADYYLALAKDIDRFGKDACRFVKGASSGRKKRRR